MSTAFTKLDQAVRDLIEAYSEVDEELEDKFGDDDDSMNNTLVEALETAIESGLDELGVSTTTFASLTSALSDALELLDPGAFEPEDDDLEEFSMEGVSESDDEYDDLDEDDEEGEEEEEDDA